MRVRYEQLYGHLESNLWRQVVKLYFDLCFIFMVSVSSHKLFVLCALSVCDVCAELVIESIRTRSFHKQSSFGRRWRWWWWWNWRKDETVVKQCSIYSLISCHCAHVPVAYAPLPQAPQSINVVWFLAYINRNLTNRWVKFAPAIHMLMILSSMCWPKPVWKFYSINLLIRIHQFIVMWKHIKMLLFWLGEEPIRSGPG